MTGRIPARTAKLAVAALTTAAVLGAGAVSASAELVYNNIPSPTPGNMVSQAFEATSTSEFGGQVEFAKDNRRNPSVTVTMSSWACGNLKSGAECATSPGAKFEWPITLNIYGVGPGNAVGKKLATKTQTFAIPYRPSANKKCSLTSEGVVGWGKECFSGRAHNITFHVNESPPLILPNRVIIGVAYNTSDFGYAPTHGPDIGQNSLNVAVREPSETGPSIGAYPAPADAYLNSTWTGAYCNGLEGTGTFRLDSGCWTGYQPAFKVNAKL
jgi:hypothetical protein